MRNKGGNKESRRSFLKKAWAVLGVIASIEVLAITANFLMPANRKRSASDSQKLRNIGTVNDFGIGSVTPFRSGQFYLVRMEDGVFLAISLKCTHLGCSVGWDSAKNEFICPCHSSLFDIKGNVLRPEQVDRNADNDDQGCN